MEKIGAKRRGWLTILLGVTALIALGFALYALTMSWRGTRSDDARRVRDLAIAAKNIEGWPTSATQIGRSNLYHHDVENGGHAVITTKSGSIRLYHPDLTEFRVNYFVGKTCDEKVGIADDKMTVDGAAFSAETMTDAGYYERLRGASWFQPGTASDDRICFSVANLDLKHVTAVPKGFEHLMLAQVPTVGQKSTPRAVDGTDRNATVEDGLIVAHIGDNQLPIRTLTELPDVRPQMLAMAGALAQVTAGTKMPAEKPDVKRVRRDALEPLDSAVAGVGYRFYFYPVTLKGGYNYWLVGTVRDDARAATLGRLGPRILAFALALALLAALTPTLKLAMLGPVDGIKPVEAGALVFGLLTAAALATTAFIVTADVISVRNAVALRLSQSAAAIRMRTVSEIHDVLLGEGKSQIAPLSKELRRNTKPPDNSPKLASPTVRAPASLIKWIENERVHLRNYLQPDSLFPIGRDGRQAVGMPVAVARHMSGAGWELADRPYFRRVVNGDFAPGSETLVKAVRATELPGLWGCITGGLVFEQLRSRPDGVPKTVVAARVDETCVAPLAVSQEGVPEKGGTVSPNDPDENRGGLQVLGVTMVLKSLLSPPLHEREQFAVLDVSEGVAGLPVLFHSQRGRANIEPFAEALDDAARSGLASAAAIPTECAREDQGAYSSPTASLNATVETFEGTYEGEPTLFAATRLPCTDWLIVTSISRDLIDSYATMAGTHAIQIWIGCLLLAIAAMAVFNGIKRWMTGRPAWLWLWPDPAKRDRYRLAIAPLAGVALITALIAVFGYMPALAALFGPVLAGATLYAVLAAKGHPASFLSTVRSRLAPASATPSVALAPSKAASKRDVLDPTMEWWVVGVIALLVLSAAVLPIVALGRDARGYFDAQQIGDDFTALRQSREEERRGIAAVALAYSKDARAASAPLPGRVSLVCDRSLRNPQDFGLFVFTDGPPCFDDATLAARPARASFTEALRRDTLGLDKHSLFGDARLIERPAPGLSAGFFIVVLALLLGTVLVIAFRSALRGLFGFGVVLEAVPYPGLPMVKHEDSKAQLVLDDGVRPIIAIERAALPSRFIAVAAPDTVRRSLEGLTEHSIDLFDATSEAASGLRAPVAATGSPRPLLLFKNLEMLMRNRERRLKALAILERSVALQASSTGACFYNIGLLSDLSPLDRLLQSYEREAEELERLTPQERHTRRAVLAGEREDVRWSRLFESFTTYTYRAERRVPDDSTMLTLEERRAVETVEAEVAYLPDHVVAAVIPDLEPPLESFEIAKWAKTSLTGAPSRAIVDYLCSQLVEHYQLVWSVSSHAERLLLHHYAHGQLVNMGEAYALRSLVRRGLVVLDPVPRIMNRSFAQFVRNREEPETLARWRSETQRSAWQALGTPLMLVFPFALGVVAVFAIRSGESIAALLPFVVSVGPALVNFLSGNRRVTP